MLLVFVPSIFIVFFVIVVVSIAACANYSFYRSSLDVTRLADEGEKFEDLRGKWSSVSGIIKIGVDEEGKKCLEFDNQSYRLLRKSAGHYLMREGLYNWKGLIISSFSDKSMDILTNDGRTIVSYHRET